MPSASVRTSGQHPRQRRAPSAARRGAHAADLMGLGPCRASDVSTEGLRAAAEADLLAAPGAAPCSGAEDAGPAAAQPLLSRLSLKFRQPALERAFQHEWDTTRARTHDYQGAAVYCAMVRGLA